MAKKRGGKRHRAKKTDGPAGDGGSEQVGEFGDAVAPGAVNAEGTQEKTRRSTKEGSQQKLDVSEYFGRIKQLIEDCPFQGDIQFEAFVTSTVEEIVKRVNNQ